MKRIIFSLLILTAILTTAFIMTGCGEDAPKTHSAFVLGVHKNFPMPSPAELYGEIYTSVSDGGTIAAVVSDGTADTLSFERVFEVPDSFAVDSEEQNAKSNANSVVFEFLGLQADAPESDLLQAITTAAKALNSYGAGNKVIYVYDSGVSTDGLLNFTDASLIDTPPEQVAEGLRQISALPDLNGITVKWMGFGQTCGDQSPLSASHVSKLRAIWQKVIFECGATVEFGSAPISNGRNTFELPHCSTVETYEDTIATSSK